MNTQLKERPIILTAEEVNAVLAGNKTQHRVPVLTAKEIDEGFEWDFSAEGDSAVCIKEIDDERQEVLLKPCPFGAIGDRLWVQEPTLAIEDVGWIGPVFVASDVGRNAIDWGYGPYDDPAHIPACELTYNKPDDLSYENSRLLLEITDIRIERMQDITVINAQAEGSPLQISTTYFASPFHKACGEIMEWFKGYWNNKQSKMSSYEANPWVWVIEFKKVDD